MSKNKIIQYVGQKLPGSSITILEALDTRLKGKKYKRYYRIQCDCGKIKETILEKIVRTCGDRQCPFLKQFRIEAGKISGILGGKATAASGALAKYAVTKHNQAVLLEDKQNNFSITKCVFNKYKKDAKERGLEWRLEPQDILDMWIEQGGKCKQTGLPLFCGDNSTDHTWSIDRMENGKAYIKDNVQLVSKIYNMSKMSRTDAEMKALAYLLYQNLTLDEVRIYNSMSKQDFHNALQQCTRTSRK